jgi:transposase
MFVRKKNNRSGSSSVVVVQKINGRCRYVKTIGISSDENSVQALLQEGQKWIADYCGKQDLFTSRDKINEETGYTEQVLSNIENILLNGTQLILNQVFESIGFDRINDDILKNLVVARLSQPMSKSGTVDYLKSHFDEDFQLHQIYRYLDKLYDTQKEAVQEISINHTKKILGGTIGLVFYDVTTLYFEADYGDELRQSGFSKDGKHAQPQIVLGLLVSKGGYPLSYSVFNGSQYEGRTMIPVVEDFVKRFHLDDYVVVADSGLMNKTNVALLESGGHKYIIGARIKNESEELRQWIFSLPKNNGTFNEMHKTVQCRLIVGYSEKRAKKDKYNREKGIKRLVRDFGKGHISKENINKRGYNKFLDLSTDVKVEINRQKIVEDEKWDGLKGYITNTELSAKDVYEQYSGLWQVENAFRVTKGQIELRPMFHFTPKRIEAHVCLCFIAYKVYKELERILKESDINISVDKVLNIAKTITTIKVKLPYQKKNLTKTMLLTNNHRKIADLFNVDFWEKWR